MFRKLLAVTLAACAVCVLSACKDETKTGAKDAAAGDQTVTTITTTIGDAEDEEIDYLSDLSDERYDGYNFRILIRKGQLSDQYLEEDSADLVESATYRRNQLVQDMYGITITASESSDSNYDTSALNSILAGDDAYDIIFTHARAAFVYAVQGAVYNVNDIDSIHLDKPWWTADIRDSCNINGHLYVLDGDISSKSLGATMCLAFNKRIFDELGFEYPYQLVKDGEWTFDEMAYLVKKGGKDLNGDGVIEPADDQFGFYGSQWQSPMNILYTGGQKIYDKDDSGNLILSLYSAKTVQIYDEFFSLMDNAACFLGTSQTKYSGPNLFEDGRAMIYNIELQHAKTLRNMDDDFGIIPYPKFDEDDEYATAENGGTHLLVIPITVSDVERTGAITEALCAIGSRDVIPAFYEQSLKTKYTRDEESEEMIDLIRASRVFDLGYVAGGTFQSCGYDLANSNNRDFASYYAAGESAAKVKLAEFNRDYGGIEE
ncbi:MAG: ABC transporter substrate-binding protein [Eubacteriales bacterium]